MTLRVPGHRLLVKPIDVLDDFQNQVPEDLRAKGFEIAVGDKRTQLMYEKGVERGYVVQVGNMCWKDPALGYGTPDWEPWCKVGDEVVFVRYSGRPIIDPETQDELLALNDVDVFAVVE